MSDLISRRDAIIAVTGWYRKALHPENMSSYNEGERSAYRTALSEIAELPAADVRPVVLCRDCKHSVKGKESLECEKHRYVWNNLNRWVNDDDFCSWGARREDKT